MIDTGASGSVPIRSFVSHFRPEVSLKISSIELRTVTGPPVTADGEITLVIDGLGREQFLVLPGLQGDWILGSDFLGKKGAVVDYDQGRIAIGRKKLPVTRRAAFNQCLPIGEVRSVQPKVPAWPAW